MKFYMFTEKMILWSIHTWWYKGLAETNKRKWQVRKRPLSLENNCPGLKAVFSTKSKHLWNRNLYNVLRTAKSIQIQPINPILIHIVRKQRKPDWSGIGISYIFCYFSVPSWAKPRGFLSRRPSWAEPRLSEAGTSQAKPRRAEQTRIQLRIFWI